MRALISRKVGGPDTLEIGELPDPLPAPGQLLVRVAACALNFPDALIIEDRYQHRAERPFAPGSEFSGIVVAAGEGVTGWQPGDRVAGTALSGGLAERAVLDVTHAFHVPEGVDLVEASAMIFTYGTTMHALLDRARLRPGETLLVLGAAGGIGVSAIELGKLFGARVIAAVSSEEKSAFVREVGADDALVYPRGPLDRALSRALADAFKRVCGAGGADVIYDPVGGDYAEPALRAVAWEGRYLVTGFPAGIPKLPLNLVLLKSCDVRGVAWGAWAMREPEANRAHIERLFGFLAEGGIRPRITATFPLQQAAEAIAALAGRGAMGKLVVKIG